MCELSCCWSENICFKFQTLKPIFVESRSHFHVFTVMLACSALRERSSVLLCQQAFFTMCQPLSVHCHGSATLFQWETRFN